MKVNIINANNIRGWLDKLGAFSQGLGSDVINSG
jgi:hypothetical protein